MDRKYWEKIAPNYSDEIFDVLHNDKKAFIREAVSVIASPAMTVVDIGCAVGKWIPVLSPLFKKVLAVDISQKNLDIARETYPDLTNVEYKRVDMSSGKTKIPASDVAICINAILTDSAKKRDVFFSNLTATVKKNGHLILVVPSLESWLLTNIIQQKWNIDKKLFTSRQTSKQAIKRYNNIRQGNAEIDNVPTKHYLREELQLLLTRSGFHPTKFQKINYTWKTEFVKPPKWLKEPMPWDWLVVCERL